MGNVQKSVVVLIFTNVYILRTNLDINFHLFIISFV
jgi:hypothetical protein